MSVTFTKDGVSITVSSPVFPYIPDRDTGRVNFETEGGTLLSQSLKAAVVNQIFSFEDLDQDEIDDLDSFFGTTITDCTVAFTYTDPAAVEHASCHWLDERYTPQMMSEGRYALVLTLRY